MDDLAILSYIEILSEWIGDRYTHKDIEIWADREGARARDRHRHTEKERDREREKEKERKIIIDN